jgi:hypothetical protein
MKSQPDNKQSQPFSYLSLAISAIALAVIVVFLFPWIDDPDSNGERVLTGIDVAIQSTLLTDEEFPAGILFIMPLVAAGYIWEYYRKIRSPYRPRRRRSYAGMTIIGIASVLVWGRAFAVAASDCLQSGECIPLTPEQATYTAEDVVRNLYALNFWVFLGLTLLLLVLPFWDQRPEEPKPDNENYWSKA